MITMRDFMETVNYRITEGSEFGWNCYGPNAYALSSWSGDNDQGYSASIVFDTETQVVYEMTVCDYKNKRAYRLFDPKFKDAYKKVVNNYTDQAWDDVNYIDLETAEDMLDKAQSIVDGVDYDTRIQVPIELPDEELLTLFKMAHERDMTFNDFVVEVIKEQIARMEQDQNIKNLIKTDIL